MRPMMEYSIPELFLRAGLPDQKQAAEYLGVNRTTIKRWREGTTQTPQHIIELLRLLAGNPPAAAKQQWFPGWRFNQEFFISPEGDKYTEGDIRTIRLMQNQITGLEVALRKAHQQIDALQTKIAATDTRPALPDNVVQFPGPRRRVDSA